MAQEKNTNIAMVNYKNLRFRLTKCVVHSFLSFSFILFSSNLYAQQCQPDAATYDRLEKVTIASVIDGDTVILDDGRTIRLVGLNAPELARPEAYISRDWQRNNQPLSLAAKEALTNFVANAQVRIYPSVSGYDRYKRQLAHLFVSKSYKGVEKISNLTAQLIEKGLAYAVAMAPNLSFSECYFSSEKQARATGMGVWSEEQLQPIVAADFDQYGRSGFALIQGLVTRVSRSKGRVWMDIDDTVVIMVGKRSFGYFTQDLEEYEGHTIEVRGWVIDRQKKGKRLPSYKKRWLISISHASMLSNLSEGDQ